MNELIVIQPKQIGNEEINSIDARELHGKLGVKKDFTNWIKYNIEKLHLVEGVDYLLTKKGEKLPSGMKYVSEYTLTLDTGKHISMMTNTATAHDIRTYFIEFEKKAKALPVVHDPQTRALIQLLADNDKIKQEQSRQAAQIAHVTDMVADLTPKMTANNLQFLLGQINHVGKLYRQVQELKHIKITTAQGAASIMADLITHFQINDIAYIKDMNQVLKWLKVKEKQLQAEYDELYNSNTLFGRKAA